MKKSLAEIFNSEAQQSGQDRPFRTLSAEGGTNDKDATGDRRLKLLNEIGRLGKVLKKPDGTQYSSNELFSCDIDELQAAFDRAPADPSKASQSHDPNAANIPSGVGDGSRPLVHMAGLFERDNAITCLSATGRFDNSSKGREDSERLVLLRRMADEGKTPLRQDGFTPMTAKDLLGLSLPTLRLLADNCQPVRTVL